MERERVLGEGHDEKEVKSYHPEDMTEDQFMDFESLRLI